MNKNTEDIENIDSSSSYASEYDENYDPLKDQDAETISSENEGNINEPGTSKIGKKTKSKSDRKSKMNKDQEEIFIETCINEFDEIHDKTTQKGTYHNSKAERAKKDNVWSRIKKTMVDVLQVSLRIFHFFYSIELKQFTEFVWFVLYFFSWIVQSIFGRKNGRMLKR